MSSRAVAVLALSLTSLLSASAIEGQSMTVSGRIHMSGDSTRVVGDAEVGLLPGLRRVRSDAAGEFRITGVAPGLYTLRTRRVGFSPDLRDIKVDPLKGTELRVDVALRMGAQVLAEIKIAGSRTLYPVRLAEPFARASSGRGAFFTRDLIDSLKPQDAFSLLSMLPGMRVREKQVSTLRCTNSGASMGLDGHLQVYVDGLLMTRYDDRELMSTGAKQERSERSLSVRAGDVLRDIAVTSIELIEVHQSINTIPAAYLSDACGVILIWTK